ncbi:MAG: outer membrane protein assembly factor BamD [Bryobacter sp.]|nr:outer membrane protein assembly factor BamD [Bryobacter sp.]
MIRLAGLAALVFALLLASGCRKRKYENPITKDTQQPDKVLFDKAIKDIEKGRFEIARLTLQTLMNTYDTSEYLAKAKLAIADSWFREGGANGLAQAEAEYKDFILFYPTMEEAAESQEKICMIHYRQMEKSDRDPVHALRADEECRQLLVQFPNSKFAPRATQLVRNIQEALAEGEFRVGDFYHKKQSWSAATNRLQTLTDHYPLYSKADEALFKLGEGYNSLGPRFKPQAGKAYARIVRDYPLSPFADQAKAKLQELELAVPEADPAAVARMQYEIDNRGKASLAAPVLNMVKRGPDARMAAKSGTPATAPIRPGLPVSVQAVLAAQGQTGTTDVTVSTVGENSALDTNPDARLSQQPQNPSGAAVPTPPPTAETPAEGAPAGKADNSKKSGKDQKKKKN